MGAAAGLAELRGLSPLKPPVNSGARTARSASSFDVTSIRADKAVRAPGRAKRVRRISRRWLSATMDTYFAPNKTIRELHELMKSGAAIDPLKDFSEAAREELRVRL